MGSATDARREDVTPASLWLEIHASGTTRSFLLQPGDEHAIVVGSLLRADVRIDRRDIAPVHFHFEREGHEIWLVPTYKADVRVNAARIVGPCRLARHSRIEFRGLAIDAVVHRENPLSGEFAIAPEADTLKRPGPDARYIDELPSEMDATRAAPRLLRDTELTPADCAETAVDRVRDRGDFGALVMIEPAQTEDAFATQRLFTPPGVLGATGPPNGYPEAFGAGATQRSGGVLRLPRQSRVFAHFLVASLDVLAQRRPLVVAVGVLIGALILALAAVGVEKLCQ